MLGLGWAYTNFPKLSQEGQLIQSEAFIQDINISN